MSALSKLENHTELENDSTLGARQAIASSALLKELPWTSGAVFHPGSWSQYFQGSAWAQVCRKLITSES